MGLKSFAPLTIAVIGIIALVALFLIPFISLSTLKVHLVKNVELSYEYNTADLALLTLLHYEKNFPVYRILSEFHLQNFGGYVQDYKGNIWRTMRHAIPREEAIKIVNKTVANLTLSDCYELTLGSDSFVKSGSCKIESIPCFKIFIPYPGKTKDVCLKVKS
jgi:hypothetical protein